MVEVAVAFQPGSDLNLQLQLAKAALVYDAGLAHVHTIERDVASAAPHCLRLMSTSKSKRGLTIRADGSATANMRSWSRCQGRSSKRGVCISQPHQLYSSAAGASRGSLAIAADLRASVYKVSSARVDSEPRANSFITSCSTMYNQLRRHSSFHKMQQMHIGNVHVSRCM